MLDAPVLPEPVWIGLFQTKNNKSDKSKLVGGGSNTNLLYFGVFLEDGTEIGRVSRTTNGESMLPMSIDVSDYIGQNIYWEVVDNSTNNWGYIAVDDITFEGTLIGIPTTTTTCGGNTLITFGNGTIAMEGSTYYQVFDINWQEVFNCGWQCGDGQTVDNLAAGDYRIFIKDGAYQNICEKVITLSAGGSGGGNPTDNGEDGSTDDGGTDDGGTTNPDDGDGDGTNITCGDVTITYGNGTVSFTGQPNTDYFFKLNDLDSGWADAGSCAWNCGNEFTVNNLANNRFLLTVYNDDWSIHCDKEIRMTGSSIAASAENRQAPHLSFAAYPANKIIDLQWLSNSGFKVTNFEVEHSADGVHFEQLTQLINKDWSSEIAYHQTTDKTPLTGENYYRVKEIYLDGSFAYTEVKQVNFQIDLTKVSVFPNPARDELFLNLNPYVGKNATVTLVNHLGKQLIRKDIATIETDLVTMNTTQIQNGLYYLIIKVDGQKAFTKKVLIHRLY